MNDNESEKDIFDNISLECFNGNCPIALANTYPDYYTDIKSCLECPYNKDKD